LPDETEEDLVSSILEKTLDVPKKSVLKAIRMPIESQSGNSLVIVQMDTLENEMKVLKKRSDIRSSDLRSVKLDHVGVREVKYERLWNLVQELTVVKRVASTTRPSVTSMPGTSSMSTTSEDVILEVKEDNNDVEYQDEESVDPRNPKEFEILF